MAQPRTLTEPQFKARVKANLRGRNAAVQITAESAMMIEATLHGNRAVIDLGPLYTACEATPGLAAQVISKYLDERLADFDWEVTRPGDLPFPSPSLYPLIRARGWTLAAPVPLVMFPVVDVLVAHYVIDGPDRMTAVTERHRDAWGVTDADIHALALENLQRDHPLSEPVLDAQRGQPVVVHGVGDGFDASRMLLPGFFAEMSARLETEAILVGVPNRDFLMALDATLPAEQVERVQLQLEADYRSQTEPISADLFLQTAVGIELYDTLRG